MTPITNQAVRASAGTGKTFALSSRYIALLRRQAAPATILATTFTRKAAAEILERVLIRLARAAADQAGADKLKAELGDPTLTLADCRAMLAAVCHSLHRVSISTIDAFFNRVAQSFRHKLEIAPGALLVGEDDPRIAALRRRAIDDLLNEVTPGVMLDLMRRLHHDSAQRSVAAALDAIVRNLYEVYRQAPDEALWSRLQVPQALNDAALRAAIDRVASFIGGPIPSRINTALSANLVAARAADWALFCAKGLTPRIDADPPLFSRATIPEPIRAAYRPLIAHAKADLLGRCARQTRATFELLRRFDEHYTRLRRSQSLLLFADLAHKLARELPARGDELLTDIYYRLDGRVAHLLLDEFQDTSLDQWRVLRPFAQEIVAHGDPEASGRSFFCVGDAKQAIYGWRGGCAEIFEQIEQDLHLGPTLFTPPAPAPGKAAAPAHGSAAGNAGFQGAASSPTSGGALTLNESYRSSQVVLDAINRVFATIATNQAMAAHLDMAQRWQKGFINHRAHASLPGYVELVNSPATREERREERGESSEDAAPPESAILGSGAIQGADEEPDAHATFVADKIAALARAAPGRSIGVLVVTNDFVNQLIFKLRSRGVAVSGEGGAPVTDDPGVNVVLAAITLAMHPGDTVAAFHVRHSPLAEVIGLSSTDAARVDAVALEVRRALATDGYGPTVAAWARRLASSCNARGVQRLMQLIELADRFDADPSLWPTGFASFVRATPIEEPTPAAIRVMTVHKAKGLEFDAVVLPQLDRLMARLGNTAVYVVRPTPTSPIEAVYRAAHKDVRSLSPQLAEGFEQETRRRLGDDLCSLYVAMTRPRYALHMIVKALRFKSDGSPGVQGLSNLTAAAILRHGLRPADMRESSAGGEVLYCHGDAGWPEAAPRR